MGHSQPISASSLHKVLSWRVSPETFFRKTQSLVLMNQTYVPHRVPLSAKVDGAPAGLQPRRQWNHSCLLSFSHPSESNTECCWLCLQTRSCSDRFTSSAPPPVPVQASWLGVVKPSTLSQCLRLTSQCVFLMEPGPWMHQIVPPLQPRMSDDFPPKPEQHQKSFSPS